MAPEASDRSAEPHGDDRRLDKAILDSLDRLLAALTLERLGGDRFRASPASSQFDDRVFGGQLVAQAAIAGGATVVGQDLQSLHAYFVAAGDAARPIDLAVDRVRDGRSFSTRHIAITQDERPRLVVIASFHANPTTPELVDPIRPMPDPDELPQLQDWARRLEGEQRDWGRSWLERPPPLEMRIAEPPNFFGGTWSREERRHWMRLPRTVGDDPLLHAALLAHASDYLLLDMILRAHPAPSPRASMASTSLDHSLWIHRPVHFDRWHVYTQETVAFTGHRGLVRGSIHDADGQLVATAMQEGMARPAQ